MLLTPLSIKGFPPDAGGAGGGLGVRFRMRGMGGPHCSGDRAMDLRLEIRDWDLWELRVSLRVMVAVTAMDSRFEIEDLRERLAFQNKTGMYKKTKGQRKCDRTIPDWAPSIKAPKLALYVEAPEAFERQRQIPRPLQ